MKHEKYTEEQLLSMSNDDLALCIYKAILIDSNMEDSEIVRKSLVVGIPEGEPDTVRILTFDSDSHGKIQIHSKGFWVEKLLEGRMMK